MIRAIAGNGQIRAFAITDRGVVEEARRRHGTMPLASAALGRTMTGALLMSDMLKNPGDLITLKFDGDGPLGQVVATADAAGHVKGYVQNTEVSLPLKEDGHLNVGAGIGRGTLTVIRDLDMKNAYNGQVSIHSGEIADDLTWYFAESEQIPSSVGLGILVDTDLTIRRAGGFVVQLMPFAAEETIEKLEANVKKLPYVTELLEQGMSPEDMLETILEGFDLTVTEKVPVSFQCSCTRERVERALLLVGKKELREMIAEDHPFSINCQFCGKVYTFTREELEKLLPEAR